MLSYSEGTEKMKKIASSIREGAQRLPEAQYSTVAKVFAVVFVILLVIAFASNGQMLSKFTPFAFVTGGIWSMLAGFIGMKIATNANARTAQAASESLNRGLRVAFSSRLRHGLHCGWPGHAGHLSLVRHPLLRLRLQDATTLGNIMV